MPEKTIHFRKFTNGLYLASDVTEMPEGFTRRNRGISPLPAGLFRSRDGSTQLHDLDAAHSLVYFSGDWYAAASTTFYKGVDTLKQNLAGDRLSFTIMPPVAGNEDYLFVAGGDELFKVSDDPYLDDTELITNGDMELDSNWADYNTPDTNERSSTQAFSGTYSRKFVADSANPNGDGIRGDAFTTVSLTWYRGVCWVYQVSGAAIRISVRNGANDGWAYDVEHDTLVAGEWTQITFNYLEALDKGGAGAYIVFTVNALDPSGWYVDDVSILSTVYVTNWGITPPPNTFTAADGGAGGELDDGAVYKYRLTYYNDETGTRSNPTTPADDGEVDSQTKLLLHCEGGDATTTFTDDGYTGHTGTAQANAQIDTAQKKFGAASGLFDGSNDYVSFPDHADWSFGSDPFTVDFWVRFNDVSITQRLFTQWQATGYHYNLDFYGATDLLYWQVRTSYNRVAMGFTWAPSVDTWYHVAIIRGWDNEPNTWAITIDGTLLGSTFDTSSMPELTGTFNVGGRGAGLALDGWLDEFRVSKGVARWTEDFTPPISIYGIPAVDLAGGSTSVDLSDIPVSADAQVTHVEIWRTVGGGSTYFLLTRLPLGTTSYTDDVADSLLESTELPTDNIKPYAWFDDCFGPYNASMFMLTRTQAGERGRLYYSPVGRAESMEGFIDVSEDSRGLQRGALFNDTPFVFGIAGVYQIFGNNPYFSRQVGGVPGTNNPHTIAVTPAGIMYEAEDGVRLFNGSSSVLVATENVQMLFRGQAVGALTAFSGVVAAYAREEYFISDETQLLVFNFRKGSWRDLGDLAVKAIDYAKDADIIGMATNADGIYEVEKEGETDDNSNDIEIDLETYHVRLGDDKEGVVKQIHIDHESSDAAAGQTLTVYLVHDGTSTTLGTVANYARSIDSLPVNRACREFGIRITGSVDEWIKIYRISAEVYTPQEEVT